MIDAISFTLDAEFGDGHTVYTESIAQGLKEPCFFVQLVEGTNNLFRGKRYYRTQKFCIQYFPRDRRNAQAECAAVAERLYSALEYLTLQDEDTIVKGKDMSHNTFNGILNFFVNYDFFVQMQSDEVPMETLDFSTREKKGV